MTAARRLALWLVVPLVSTVAAVLGTATPSLAANTCAVTYQVTVQWPSGTTGVSGFQSLVNIRNTGSAPTNGWTVTLVFAPGVTLGPTFGGARPMIVQPPTYVFSNQPWTAVIAPNATSYFGIQGTATSPATPIPVSTSCTTSQ